MTKAHAKAHFNGIDLAELERIRSAGRDHGDNPIEPYIDDTGGWPLRCCLGYSEPGEQLALIAWSPFPWKGVYAETGPIFVHADSCDGPQSHEQLPTELNSRAMVLRPYTHDHRIAYHHVRHVPQGESLATHVEELLAEPDVDFVHGRNVTGGCYSFEARLSA